MQPTPGQHVDHAGDSLDNRRYSEALHSGIRIATRSQNMAHRGIQANNTSGFSGVFPTEHGTFVAAVGFQGKNLHLGTFATALEAAIVRDKKVIELFGAFAFPNIPVQTTVELLAA